MSLCYASLPPQSVGRRRVTLCYTLLLSVTLLRQEESYSELLQFLSPGLQGRLSMELMMHVLDQVPALCILILTPAC